MGAIPAFDAKLLYGRNRSSASPDHAWREAAVEERAWAACTARQLERLGIRAVTELVPEYPEGLRDLRRAPRVIFLRGDLPPLARAVAIVGSRAASPYGIVQSGTLAGDLARLGFWVVSGLARGVDAAAHRGALEAGGASLAVLPGGLDSVAPRHHAALAESLVARGGLMSEWPSGPPASRGLFAHRNRLIAAMASATVVVEASSTSGALSTAEWARNLGRTLLAVPGDVDRPTSRGVHALLRSGARLCECAGDVVQGLAAATPELPETPEARLAGALATEPLDLETLAKSASVPVETALAVLLRLEWSGAAVSRPGQRWARRSP